MEIRTVFIHWSRKSGWRGLQHNIWSAALKRVAEGDPVRRTSFMPAGGYLSVHPFAKHCQCISFSPHFPGFSEEAANRGRQKERIFERGRAAAFSGGGDFPGGHKKAGIWGKEA